MNNIKNYCNYCYDCIDAVACGHLRCLRRFYKNERLHEDSICYYAVFFYNCDVENSYELFHNDYSCITYLYKFRDNFQKDVLYYACMLGKIEVVKLLLKINDENIDNEKKMIL